MANITTTPAQKCQVCYQFTSDIILSTLTKSTLINYINSYLYHENVKEVHFPSNPTGLPELPKLTFSISIGNPLNCNVSDSPEMEPLPKICEDCAVQLEKLEELQLQLNSVKKLIDVQMKTIKRKRVYQQAMLENGNLPNARNYSLAPGLSMAGASIGKESISQTLSFLNSICEGMPSTQLTKDNTNGNGLESTVNDPDVTQTGSDPVAPKPDGLPEDVFIMDAVEEDCKFVQMEESFSAYLDECPSDGSVDSEGSENGDFTQTKITSTPTTSNDPLRIRKSTRIGSSTSTSQKRDGRLVTVEKNTKKKKAVQYRKGCRLPKIECPECFKMVSAPYLGAHQRLHTGEFPHICEYCNRGFTQIGILQRHRANKHTKETKFDCEICGKGFLLRYYLNRHRKNVHKLCNKV